jgi:hypothetical protein
MVSEVVRTWHGMRVAFMPIDISTWQITHSRASFRTMMSAETPSSRLARRNSTKLQQGARG